MHVTLYFPGGPGTPHVLLVSQLVLKAFVGPRPRGMEGCHNDGNASNNYLSNLRWDTHHENMRDVERHGRNFYRNRTHCPRGHALALPNLVASRVKKGGRSCLACDRATSVYNYNSTREGKKQPCPYSVEQLADTYYAVIMGVPLPHSFIQLPKRGDRQELAHCRRRGHLLVEPNLVPSGLTRNKRICLACQRARVAISNAQSRGVSPPDFDTTADKYYAVISRRFTQ